MNKITKVSFMKHAEDSGLALIGTLNNKTLEETQEILDLPKNTDLQGEPVECFIRSSTHLQRGTSHLHLETTDSVYRHKQFTIIHSVYPATAGMNELHTSIVYI